MKPKFTPGPWQIAREFPTSGIEIKGQGISIAQSHALDRGTMKANAALIAAAPELYTLAEYISGCLDESGQCVIKLGEPMDEVVTKLLAKARGE